MTDALEQAIIRKLQEDLPLVLEPYRHIAEELGIGEEELLNKIKELKERKVLRRIGAILYHREVGFAANAMVVCKIPSDRMKEVAEIISSFPQVSHCYERSALPDWPYNFYAMTHSESFESCDAIILEMISAAKIEEYEVLYSTKELKKSSVKYFSE